MKLRLGPLPAAKPVRLSATDWLMQSAPADTLAINAPRALGQGWRVLVRGTDPAALDRLDAELVR